METLYRNLLNENPVTVETVQEAIRSLQEQKKSLFPKVQKSWFEKWMNKRGWFKGETQLVIVDREAFMGFGSKYLSQEVRLK